MKKVLVVMFLLTSMMLFAGGNKEKDVPKIQVTGVVRLTGSALFTELTISSAENIWYVAKEETVKLHDLQHRTVTVEGVETVSEMKFANGMPAGTRRELKNIKIISVE